MKIYTSYFGNYKKLLKDDVRMFCVAVGYPKYLKIAMPQLLNVAPTRWMLSDACSFDEYLRQYEKILNRIDWEKFRENLELMGGGKDVALCCYEKPGQFCHRHLLAERMMKELNVTIEEYPAEVVEKKPEPQMSLF